jgi:pimeloyl-ACP methyl ester carboxylesterase
MQSLALQNAPALLDEEQWRAAILGTQGAAARRKVLLPILGLLACAFPNLPLPLSTYLDFGELIDTYEPARSVEERLVNDGYRKDPDFDRCYPLSAVLSLVTTPPPRPLAALRTPTLFIVARRGFMPPNYFRDLYERLPPISKQLTEGDGSVYWMLSHPSEAAALICGWFARSLSVETASAASAGM